MTERKVLNVRGKLCPVPAAITGKKLGELRSGDILEVLTDDKASLKDIPAVVKSLGHNLKEIAKEAEGWRFLIEVK